MSAKFEVGFFGRNIPGNNLKEICLSDDSLELIPGDGFATAANSSYIESFASGHSYKYPIDEVADRMNAVPSAQPGRGRAGLELF